LWFGVKLHAPFAEGTTVRGQITHPGESGFDRIPLARRADASRSLRDSAPKDRSRSRG
jgi:hypothetical protein